MPHWICFLQTSVRNVIKLTKMGSHWSFGFIHYSLLNLFDIVVFSLNLLCASKLTRKGSHWSFGSFITVCLICLILLFSLYNLLNRSSVSLCHILKLLCLSPSYITSGTNHKELYKCWSTASNQYLSVNVIFFYCILEEKWEDRKRVFILCR